MSQNQATNSSVPIFKWMYIDNVSKQICSRHSWIILLSFTKPKNYAFYISFNKASWCKNMIGSKCRRISIYPHQDIFSTPNAPSLSHVFACWSQYSEENLMFLYVIPRPHAVYHLPGKFAFVVW